jgi:biopolymer transport protein ExbD
MARKRRLEGLQTVSDINMTPLMDLTFLLLIVFMITAPMLQYGLNVSPPEFNAERVEPQKETIVTLSQDGQLYLGERLIALADLPGTMVELIRRQPEATVYIQGDGARPYREVMNIMKVVRNAGVHDVSLITEPEKR